MFMAKPSRFKTVSYKNLNARQKELFNFQKLAATLADCGYNCIKLADDWRGADFLAYRMDGTETLKVQLKSRIHDPRKAPQQGYMDSVSLQGRLVPYRA
ncbi:MAG: hypothetical protein ACRD4E_05815 [Bryobacteraceae bacterium]